MLKKFLTGLLILLVVLTLIELVYYFRLLNKNQAETPDLDSRYSFSKQGNLGINPENAKEMIKLFSKPKDLLIGSVITNTYRGKIKRLETKEGKVGSFSYVFLLSIADLNDNEYGQVFSAEEFNNKLHIDKKDGEAKKQASSKDLKKGQLIEWEQKIDLAREFNSSLISANITILE